MPDIPHSLPTPHVNDDGVSPWASLPGAVAMWPAGQYSPQLLVLVGNEDLTHLAQDNAGTTGCIAIAPEDVDKMLAVLIEARDRMYRPGHRPPPADFNTNR